MRGQNKIITAPKELVYLSLGSDASLSDQANDIQTQLLQETRQKLFGRNVSRAAQFCPSMMNCGSFLIRSNCHRGNQMSTPIIQMQSAFEHFNEYRSTLKMTTG